jgi:hypothetical protein
MAAGSDTESRTATSSAATWIGGITGAIGAIIYAIAIGGGTAAFASPAIFAAAFFTGFGVDRARDNCASSHQTTSTETESASLGGALLSQNNTATVIRTTEESRLLGNTTGNYGSSMSV